MNLDGLTIANNHAQNIGGGLLLRGGGLLTDLVLTSNVGDLPGGAAHLDGDYDIRTSTFSDNTSFDGAAIEMGSGTVGLRNCTVTDNSAFQGPGTFGGGVHMGGGRLVSITTDWGPAASNLPVDVSIGGAPTWDVTGVASFTCDAAAGTCQ